MVANERALHGALDAHTRGFLLSVVARGESSACPRLVHLLCQVNVIRIKYETDEANVTVFEGTLLSATQRFPLLCICTSPVN